MMELSYRRHRFPPVVIQHAVWLYLRFTLSYRDVEDLLAERGLDISYETVRSWVLKFGPVIARRLRRRRPRPSDRWHLDEMVVRIAGKRMYLWRAVDHEGEVLDMLVQRRRDSRGGAAVDAQAPPKARVCAKIAGDRQAALLRLGVPPFATDLPARTGASEQQSGRELAPACTATRAQDAAVQIGSIGPAFPQHACRRSQRLQLSTSSRLAINAADFPSRGRERMAECSRGSVNCGPASGFFDRDKLI
jgi:hypothetical protein